jgi:hypothetical protein
MDRFSTNVTIFAMIFVAVVSLPVRGDDVPNRGGFSIGVAHPFFEAGYLQHSSVWIIEIDGLSGRYSQHPIEFNLPFVYAKSEVHDAYNLSKTVNTDFAMGNPYFGIKLTSNQSGFSYGLGMRLPLLSNIANDAFDQAKYSDVFNYDALVQDHHSIKILANYKNYIAGDLYGDFNIYPVLLFASREGFLNYSDQFSLNYRIHFTHKDYPTELTAGVSGLIFFQNNHILGDDHLHMNLDFGFGLTLRRITKLTLIFRLPVSDDLRDINIFTMGLNISNTL